MKNIFTLAIVGTFISTVANSATECTLDKLTRKVEVNYSEAGKKAPCAVKYTKEDVTSKDVANATAQEGVCEEKAKLLIDKLTGFGWKCQEK